MVLIEAVKKIQKAGMQVLLEADPVAWPSEGSGLRAYAWSDDDGYEFSLTVPVGVYDPIDEDEVKVLEPTITKRRRNAA